MKCEFLFTKLLKKRVKTTPKLLQKNENALSQGVEWRTSLFIFGLSIIPSGPVVHGVTWNYLIQCKICYTSGNNAFYLLCTLMNKTWVGSIFRVCFRRPYRILKWPPYLAFFEQSLPQKHKSYVFSMIVFIYVCQNPLGTSFDSFSRIQGGRQIQNGHHFFFLSTMAYCYGRLLSFVIPNDFHY